MSALEQQMIKGRLGDMFNRVVQALVHKGTEPPFPGYNDGCECCDLSATSKKAGWCWRGRDYSFKSCGWKDSEEESCG